MKQETEIRFLTDQTLGKLTKWLRILGYDTVSYDGPIDRTFLREGVRERRIVLTRRRDMAKRSFTGRLIIIGADRIREQLQELLELEVIVIQEKKFFSRCLICNDLLVAVSVESFRKDALPLYVLQTQQQFTACEKCRRIYWGGSHRERARAFLSSITAAI